MSDLVVIVYPALEKAEEVRKRLFELQIEYIIKLVDAVIATKSPMVRSSCIESSTQRHPVLSRAASGVC
jgi:uncharacterized membrane protein